MSRKKKKREIRDVKTLEGAYTIDEIEDVVDDIKWEKKVILWIEPENILDVDYEGEREKMLRHCTHPSPNEDESIISPIGFTLSELLIGDFCSENAFQGTLNPIKERLPKLLKNAIFVAKNAYAFSPAFDVFWCKKLVTKDNVYDLLEIAKSAYYRANDCERLFLALLFYEFFDAIYCEDYITPEDEECIGMDFFNHENQAFLKSVKELAIIGASTQAEEYLKKCTKQNGSTHE